MIYIINVDNNKFNLGMKLEYRIERTMNYNS